jgi:glyoxylase-like metal-dependent hydrolase (beta-lactamase superfamily II)
LLAYEVESAIKVEIVPGVHLVEGMRGSNVYLLVGDELVLIDTGMSGNTDNVMKYIKELGREPEDLASIIITHGHIDHMGSLYKLRDVTGAKTIAHADEVMVNREGKYVLSPFIEASHVIWILLVLWLVRLALRFSGIEIPLFVTIITRAISITILLLIFGFITVPRLRLERALFRFGKFERRSIDNVVRDGDVLPYVGGLRVIHTPGHTPGSMSLLLAQSRVLIAGDTIINNKDRLSRPLPLRADRDESEQSLQKLAQLDFDVCCFGHGPPLYSAKERVRELAMYYPRTHLLWRIVRNWQRLVRFGMELFRRH